jgi:hypothetical protein
VELLTVLQLRAELMQLPLDLQHQNNTFRVSTKALKSRSALLRERRGGKGSGKR